MAPLFFCDFVCVSAGDSDDGVCQFDGEVFGVFERECQVYPVVDAEPYGLRIVVGDEYADERVHRLLLPDLSGGVSRSPASLLAFSSSMTSALVSASAISCRLICERSFFSLAMRFF